MDVFYSPFSTILYDTTQGHHKAVTDWRLTVWELEGSWNNVCKMPVVYMRFNETGGLCWTQLITHPAISSCIVEAENIQFT